MAMRKAVGFLGSGDTLPEGFGYTLKRRLLGPPLVNEQLSEERLSKPLALGVLSCDGISSANYGSELILHELLPFFGLAAFSLLLPMTGVIILGIALVVLSYREVVSVYTRAGGSYVVARENFGPRVAQVAAVALMVDYVVTVAVQTAAGSAAILSTFPALAKPLGDTTTLLLIAVAATLIMCYGNLRGVRENGKMFGVPTYWFSGVSRPDDRHRRGPRDLRRPAAREVARRDRGSSATTAACSRSPPSSSWAARSPTEAPR